MASDGIRTLENSIQFLAKHFQRSETRYPCSMVLRNRNFSSSAQHS